MASLFRQTAIECQLDLKGVTDYTEISGDPEYDWVTNYDKFDKFASKVQKRILEYVVTDDDRKTRTFPGFQEKNHLFGHTPLPLKDDWNTVCPYNLTTCERQEKCMSVQESKS